MIDSSQTKALCDAIQQFREYIIQGHGSDSRTARDYIRIVGDFQRYAEGKGSAISTDAVFQEYYSVAVG